MTRALPARPAPARPAGRRRSRTGSPLHPQFVAATIDRLAADDAVFIPDVGTPCIWAARYLRMNGRRRLIGSFNHGSDGQRPAAGHRRAGRPARPAGRHAVRRRRARDAARRAAHAAAAAAPGEGRRVQQRGAVVRRARDEGRRHRQLRHRPRQSRLRRGRRAPSECTAYGSTSPTISTTRCARRSRTTGRPSSRS